LRERLVTLGCALAALAVFVTLFFGGQGEASRAARPTTIERQGDGLQGAFTWLRAEGVRVVSLRERFETLRQRRDLAPSGNLMIVTLPVAVPYRAAEYTALEAWLREGNSLLVLAALSDRPAWGRTGLGFQSDLQQLTGLNVRPARTGSEQPTRAAGAAGTEAVPDAARAGTAKRAPSDPGAELLRAIQELPEPQRGTLLPNKPHAYLQDVRSAVAWSDYSPQPWVVSVPRDGFVLSLAHERESGAEVLWVASGWMPRTVIVSGYGSLFSNRALGLADNARLLGNIVASTLRDRGAVLFDDEHQGVTAAYDPAKFYRDPRLYATLGVLAAVWLTWVLGSTRLRLPAQGARAPRELELVRITGGFLARVLRPAAAARRMFELFFARLSARLPHGRAAGPAWELLESSPRLPRADVQQLRDWYAAAYSEQRVPLARLHNLIVDTERRLAQ
jgi:hypothetical protein